MESKKLRLQKKGEIKKLQAPALPKKLVLKSFGSQKFYWSLKALALTPKKFCELKSSGSSSKKNLGLTINKWNTSFTTNMADP